MRPKIGRMLLKVSGEIFGSESVCLDNGRIEGFAAELQKAAQTCSEIAVVIGGGNILRGAKLSQWGIDRVSADQMGMLGTIINAIALQSVIERGGIGAHIMSAIPMGHIAETYTRRSALRHLEEGHLIILAGGTGNPYFTTDTAAALRAVEIKADALLKGTKVDGIFSSDPVENPDATMIDELSYTDFLKDDLRVMDATAVALCRENGLPIIVFNFMKKDNLRKILNGEKIGTIVQ